MRVRVCVVVFFFFLFCFCCFFVGVVVVVAVCCILHSMFYFATLKYYSRLLMTNSGCKIKQDTQADRNRSH